MLILRENIYEKTCSVDQKGFYNNEPWHVISNNVAFWQM